PVPARGGLRRSGGPMDDGPAAVPAGDAAGVPPRLVRRVRWTGRAKGRGISYMRGRGFALPAAATGWRTAGTRTGVAPTGKGISRAGQRSRGSREREGN